MSKGQSQREQDLARRQSASSGIDGKRLLIGAIVALVILAAIFWATRTPSPEDRDGNFAAFGLSDDPFQGDPAAPVVLVGYESPHCSSCQYFHQNTLPELQPFIDRGELVYFYIQGTIGNDVGSSVAQECAYLVGGNAAFWDITDRLYARGDTYTAPDWGAWLDDLAARQDLDAQRLRACVEAQETAGRVDADLRVGRHHGAQGTPTFWAFTDEGPAVAVERFTDTPQLVAELLERSPGL